MRSKFPMAVLLLLALMYVGFGDQVLPSEIGKYSAQIRASADNMLVGIFPSWRPKTDPNQRTEKAIEKLDRR